VWKFPLAIVAPDIDESTPRVHLGALENRFVFLHSFDYLSVVARKNPIGVIEAYRRAFTPADETALVIKSINAKARPDDHAAVRFAARGRDDIVLADARLDAPQNASLIAGADCIVSLHRSEGFGLNLADALALGRPVIATGYGGNLEFMADLPEWLVPYRMVDVGPGQHPYPSDARWADPDLDAAAAIMRAIRDDSPRANARAEEARRDLTERFSLVRAGGTMAQRLQSLGDDRSRRERRLLRRR
jgi:glycosyltransferase involved in cell wall biosynthesis